jgi:hypothetical protein
MKLVPPALVVLLSIILVTGFSQDNKSDQKGKNGVKALHLPPLPPEGTGDPPVTLSNGSLNVYDRAGWKDNQATNPTVITSLPADGTLYTTGCADTYGSEMEGDGHSTSTYLAWDTDTDTPPHFTSWDIAPSGSPTTITITYGDGKNKDTIVTVTVPVSGPIIMETKPDSWGGKPTDPQRSHKRSASVRSIKIAGSSHNGQTWTPDPNHPRFRLAFCFH